MGSSTGRRARKSGGPIAVVLLAGLLAGLLAVGGCAPGAGVLGRRHVGVELHTAEGTWRIPAAQRIVLQRSGWEVRIVDSTVSTTTTVPRLEKLSLEIVNTSATQPLVVEPGCVAIETFAGAPLRGGPEKLVLLVQNEPVRITFAPGLRADALPYPFSVTITVRRPDAPDPMTATLELY